MEVAIARYYGIRKYTLIPNISWGLSGMHECDLFVYTKAGVVTEIELKRSKSDLLADFKKGHDHKDRANRISYFFFGMPDDLYEKVKDLIPEDAGILVCYRFYNEWARKECDREQVLVRKVRDAKKRRNTRNLTAEEQLKVAKLGCMRIWTLKEKIIKLQNDNTKI
jgi:hypothetical protein